MWVDVLDLRDFYAAPLGRLVGRVLRQRLRTLWPDTTGQRVLGVGFATPLLSQFQDEAERVIAVMPRFKACCIGQPNSRDALYWQMLLCGLFPTLAGVNVVEATKQIYVAPTRATNIRRVKDYILVPGAATPARTVSLN
ncbi:MAG: hypothetical protein ACKVKT_09685 [Rhodospirillales bacterium]|jgi:hypothetical protein